MPFCWHTSFIGFPNFLKSSGPSTDLANQFLEFVRISEAGGSYEDVKAELSQISANQVETRKAAFQEFGLLYVLPGSDAITVTRMGAELADRCRAIPPDRDRTDILRLLAHGLCRFQFNNPLPLGGPKRRREMAAVSIRPYLAAFVALSQLDGILYDSEFNGGLVGLQSLSDLPGAIEEIRQSRINGQRLVPLECLPDDPRTADNLRIYFYSHLSLDWEIAKRIPASNMEEPAVELTEFGEELLRDVLGREWPEYESLANFPVAESFEYGERLPEYFRRFDVGPHLPSLSGQGGDDDLDSSDARHLRDLPLREYREGRRRLVSHVRRERNQQLSRDAKRRFKEIHGQVYCEICGFDFGEVYGPRGEDFIEAHHRSAIATTAEERTVTIDDLSLVCSNCHRMLHRPPWTTVEELGALLEVERTRD